VGAIDFGGGKTRPSLLLIVRAQHSQAGNRRTMQHSLPQVQVGISHAIASEVRHGVSPALSHLLPQVGPIAQLS